MSSVKILYYYIVFEVEINKNSKLDTFNASMHAEKFVDSARECQAAERWSVHVNRNWRLTFEFRDGQAHVIDYEDYH